MTLGDHDKNTFYWVPFRLFSSVISKLITWLRNRWYFYINVFSSFSVIKLLKQNWAVLIRTNSCYSIFLSFSSSNALKFLWINKFICAMFKESFAVCSKMSKNERNKSITAFKTELAFIAHISRVYLKSNVKPHT